MSFTLSPEAQLTAGLMALLVPALSGLVSPANIRTAWTDANSAATLASQPNTPLVIIQFGPSVQSKQNPAGNAGGNLNSKGAVNLTPDQFGNVTSLVEVLREDVPVTFIVQCNGLRGKTTRDAVVNRIIATLGQLSYVGLPDSLEAIVAGTPWTTVTDPTLTLYGQTAKVVFKGKKPVDNNDERQEYRYDVVYTATYSTYSVEIDPLVTGVDITVALQH